MTKLDCEIPTLSFIRHSSMSPSLSPGLKKAEKEVTNLLDKHLGLGPSSSSHKPPAPQPPAKGGWAAVAPCITPGAKPVIMPKS